MAKTSLWKLGAFLAIAAGAALGQAPLAFEVATIRPATMPTPEQILAGKLHVGMKVDKARVDIGLMSLADLIRTAYKVKPYQLSGPDWMNSQRFDVLAKMPDGAAEDQVPEMLQTLLAERFKMTMHRDGKERPIYALVVGKNGPKLKEAPPDTPVEDDDKAKGAVIETGQGKVRINQDGKGGAVINGGPNGTQRISMVNGAMHIEVSKVSMEAFAEMLTPLLDRPVFDMTGLKGNYQITLDLSMADLMTAARRQGVDIPGGPGAAAAPGGGPADAASDSSGGIFADLQQLGLKLESRKTPIDMIVIDHLEKNPTEN